MLSKLSVAGQNGQFRTPRHIIRMMVKLTRPKPLENIADLACGTAGEYIRDNRVQGDPPHPGGWWKSSSSTR
jgi:type I restriction enzyme M protein